MSFSPKSFSRFPKLDISNSPGPGAYTVSPRLGSGGKFCTSSPRAGVRISNITPGPGSYRIPVEFGNDDF